MARLLICDTLGEIRAKIEVRGHVMSEALDSEEAENVLRCAVLMAMSSLAEGGIWPAAALENMAVFMEDMRAYLQQSSFH